MVGCCVAAVVATASGPAYAADNLPPKQPLVQDLQTGSKACAAGDEKVYVAEPPTLTAVLYDPEEDNQPAEANLVKGEFEAWWTDSAGVEQRRTHTTPQTLSGTRQLWRMPEDIPANTVVSWHVRANDGTASSAWSSDAEGSVCQFVYDDASPEKAVVTSPDYPEEQFQDGVGVYGGFTMASPSSDVVEYRYNFIGGPYATVRPDEMGGPATIRFLPLKSAPDYLSVRAIDRSGRSSGTTTYHFFVKSGRAPVAHWKLDDAAGSTTAAAETGSAARAGTGVTFGGPGPEGTGVTSTAGLDGSSHGFLTPSAPAVDTRRTFAVSAWVRPAQTDRTMTVASQDTGRGAGFALGLRSGGSGAAWSFAIGDAQVSGGAPETGEWAHLLGLYDAETGRAQLYVNGYEVDTKAEAAPAEATGAFQIGRVRAGSGYRHRWHGDIGDVRVHDRVVVPDEAAELARRTPKLLGHWSLEAATDGVSPEQKDGAPLRLAPGATIYQASDNSCIPEIDPDCPYVPPALVGDGHLRLDGEGGHAATDGPVVDTGDSFTLGVVVRLADSQPAHPMTVLSQAGEHTDAFKVRYEPSTHAWQLVVREKDEAGAAERVVSRIQAADGGEGQGHRLAVVYDDATDKIRLYLDGYTNAQATADFPKGWHSTGPLQVGRAHTADGWGEYLHGDVDEIQAYAGALRDKDILGLGRGTDPCLC
ncbi:LamG domain-containing protein [Streptomyces sp. NBC_00841]|uniref:LamG domain-containing protein n=1 Tax=unclassified Streptomyces TaxID=2593676 RepID=UPI002255C679|nr:MULTISPECIES: LamG-like jellyroll fold domain-containing protein [unclassified Streptomyces]MCX4533484.1 LamG domain-containing protein [Streptomyces sp. NBC_01669]WSA04478.1 LamG domain-containing protein [Streptomyces sp. NBC_00841]